MAGHLPACVAPVLFAVAHRDADQAGGRQRDARAADDLDDFLFLRKSCFRARASAARRDHSPQAAHAAPSRVPARKRSDVLHAARTRDVDDILAWAVFLLAAGTAAKKDRERSCIEALYGCSAKPGR